MKQVFYATIYHFYYVLCYILALHVSDCCGNEFLVVYWKFVCNYKKSSLLGVELWHEHPT